MENKDLLSIAEEYILSIRRLEEIVQRISLLLSQQTELNEEILRIEEEYGKFDYTNHMRGKIARVIPCGSFEIPVIELSKHGPKVLDFYKNKKVTHFLTVVQEKYRKLNSKKIKINLELQNLEEEREKLHEKIDGIDAQKLREELTAEKKAAQERLGVLSETHSKISRRKEALEETLAANSKRIKEVFYGLGVNMETAFNWYLEERFAALLGSEKKGVEKAKHFLSIYLKKKQLEYIENYFSSLIKIEEEKLRKIENYAEKLKP